MTHKTSNVHLVIVTGQAQANLIPILQLKPEVVVLAVSEDMKNTADEFVELLKRAAYYQQKNILRFNKVPAVGIAAIEKKALEIYQALQQRFPKTPITYHATGGTKLMALGFYSVFAKENNIAIYTDTADGYIEFIYPREQPIIAIEHVLKMETYLRSLGAKVRASSDNAKMWRDQAEHRLHLTHWLAENADLLDGFFKEMNFLVTLVIDKNQKDIIKDKATQFLNNSPNPIYQKALAQLKEYGICLCDPLSKKITFDSIDGARYISGFWLEEYVWLIAKDLDISEVKANVEFSALSEDNVINEMDCIAVHNNRLLAIECKTASLDKDIKVNNNILNKLENLSKAVGGLYHEKWLVSARPVLGNTQERAKLSKIKIIAGNELKNLKTELEKWRDGKR